MKTRDRQSGFTAVELLITLFVAAAFFISGYQLYSLIIKDSGQARAEARAANVAYDYMRRYANVVTVPCSVITPLTNSAISVSGLSSVTVSVAVSCPYSTSSGTNSATNISRVLVTVLYNNPQRTVQYATFVGNTSGSSSITVAPPTSLTATANSVSQITLNWTAPSSTPISYTLQYATDNAFTSPTTITGITSTNKVLTGLSTSLGYYFRVQTVDTGGISAYSNTASAATYTNWGVYSMIAGTDWNGDSKNDIIAYKSDGTLDLHLGNNDGTFGPGYNLGNIGTSVKSLAAPGKLPGGTAPIIWWYNSNGSGFFLTSNGSTGVAGSIAASGATGTWSGCDSAFAGPGLVTSITTAVIVCKADTLYVDSLDASGTPTTNNSFGSGWLAAYPGNSVFDAGDFIGNDGRSDIAAITTAGACNTYQGLGNGTTNGGVANGCGSGWLNNFVTGGLDFTGDGKLDFLRIYTPTSTMYIYPGNGGGTGGFNAQITVN